MMSTIKNLIIERNKESIAKQPKRALERLEPSEMRNCLDL
jgi:hypothetical protein